MRGEGRHGGMGHEGGRMRGGRGGGGRLFEHGAMRWVLLSLIAQKPSHGYELIKAIETRMAGVYAPSPGVIYPSLSLLEDMGAVSIATESGKKLYAVTEEGLRLLQENAEILAKAEARMDALKGHMGRPAEIQEAVEAFRTAVRERLAAEETLDAETVARIAALIHEAAKKVSLV